MDIPTRPDPRPEPDFMPRIRRLFAEGLPERIARMHRGLDGVAAAVAAGRAPSAEDLGFEAGRLSTLIGDWRPDAPPGADDIARARELLGRVEEASEAARARIGAEAGGRSPRPPEP
jgi:hypothetical protein